MKKITVIILFLFLAVNIVFGHGLGGSLEQKAGEFTIVLGYNTFKIESGKTMGLNFELKDGSGSEVDFERALVEIRKNEETMLSVFVNKPNFGETSLDYLFHEPGNYQIEVKFVNKDESGFDKGIAEAVFDFPVEGSPTPWYKNLLFIGGVVGLVAGASATLLFLKRK